MLPSCLSHGMGGLFLSGVLKDQLLAFEGGRDSEYRFVPTEPVVGQLVKMFSRQIAV